MSSPDSVASAGLADAPAASSRVPDSTPSRPIAAHKFGGSSLANVACLRHVAGLVQADAARADQVVVASAMHKVTDALIALCHAARSGAPSADDWRTQLQALRERHLAVAADLDPEDHSRVGAWLAVEFAALAAQLTDLAAGHGDPAIVLDRVQGLGEVWSSRLLQCALGGERAGWIWLDAREVLSVAPGDLGVRVDWPRTRERMARWRAAHPGRHLVVTGFIASDADGRPTTLGRNGSDYSGAIFAVLGGAASLDIWTDVDGILSADPRLVPDAVPVPAMSYEEACELAYFGAKVIHPQTLGPAMQHGLAVRIRNTFQPAHQGTLLGAAAVASASPVKGLSLVPGLAVLEVSGAAMVGVHLAELVLSTSAPWLAVARWLLPPPG